MALDADTPIRKKAFAYLEKLKPSLPLRSNEGGVRGQLYKTSTGNDHQFFLDHWAESRPNDKTTGCNGFTGAYVKDHLKGPYVGGFFIDTGFPKAWVASDGDNRPGYGDVCLHTGRGHVSVVLDIDPWVTIQGGFTGSGRKPLINGKQTGFDVIGVGNEGAFDPSRLMGWLDLDKLFPAQAAVPFWVLGWWSVTWDEDTYYYYFGVDWAVYWTYRRPRSVTEICVNVPSDGGAGTFTVTGSLNITWRSGSKEQFWYGNTPWPKEFWGKHNGEGVLHVKRLG